MQLKAVINIGANVISMTLAEIGSKDLRVVETLEQPTSIGEDSFSSGSIRNETINAAITTLKGYLRLLREYAVDPKNIKAVATGAVRDADNADTFIDRVAVATQLSVRVPEPSEVNRVTFSLLKPYLSQIQVKPNNLLLALHIGREDTEFIGIKNGQVEFANLFRFGTVRVRTEVMATADLSMQLTPQLVAGFEKSMLRIMEHIGGLKNISLVLLGEETRLAAMRLGHANMHACIKLQIRSLQKVLREAMAFSPQNRAAHYNISLADAESLPPALYITTRLMEELKLRTTWFCPANLMNGLFLENGSKPLRIAMDTQTIGAAWRILAHYHGDEAHAKSVLTLAKTIFKATQKQHGLGSSYRLLLEAAAILHDAGTYVSHHAHHKHSAYLIQSSDIFGLTAGQQHLVALTARYHRRALPQLSHECYAVLPRKEKNIVNKLAAILRVADSLDNTHRDLLRNAEAFVKDEVLYIKHPNVIYATGELVSLGRKKDLFVKTFGLDVKLI